MWRPTMVVDNGYNFFIVQPNPTTKLNDLKDCRVTEAQHMHVNMICGFNSHSKRIK